MSNALLNLAWKQPMDDPAAKLVLVRLADAADSEGKCWPSLALIAEETGLHRATVCRKIDLLESGHLVTRDRRKNGTTYHLHLSNQSHSATSSVPQVVAQCDQLKPSSSRRERLVAECDQSHSATQVVAQCDTGSRTVRLPYSEPKGTQKNHQQQEAKAPQEPQIVERWKSGFVHFSDEPNSKQLEEVQDRVNKLHPGWTKRPHWTRKELDCLFANSRPWIELEEEDWTLLTAYMAARIPSEWKSDPRDFFQPDTRLGLIGTGPTTILGFADRWQTKCRRAGLLPPSTPNP